MSRFAHEHLQGSKERRGIKWRREKTGVLLSVNNMMYFFGQLEGRAGSGLHHPTHYLKIGNRGGAAVLVCSRGTVACHDLNICESNSTCETPNTAALRLFWLCVARSRLTMENPRVLCWTCLRGIYRGMACSLAGTPAFQ